MKNLLSGTHYYDEAKNAKNKFGPVVTLILFLLVFMLSQSVQSFVIMPLELPMFREYMTAQGIENDPGVIMSELMNFLSATPAEYAERSIIINLISTVIPAAIALLFCRFVEGRSLYSMGLVKDKAPVKYLIGIGAGAAAFSAALFVVVLSGSASFAGMGTIANPLMYAVICIGWIIQGAEEEIVCRGWLMSSLSAKLPMWAAVLISASFFSVMHLFNGGFSLLAALNILLIGVIFSLVTIRANSLIPACAMHSVWNWIQGNFYGLPVSGMNTGSSVFRFELGANELWTGGVFGVESGLGATIVCVAVIALLVFVPVRKKTETPAA